MRIVFCLLFLFSFRAVAFSKVAVFDLELAIQSTSDGKIAKNKLLKEFKPLESQLKKQEFSLREKAKDFEKKALILSEGKRQKQRQELETLSLQFQKKLQEFQVALQQRQMEETKPIVEKLQKKVVQVAKELDCDVVINKSSQNVLWAKEAIDITQKVLAKYEKAS